MGNKKKRIKGGDRRFCPTGKLSFSSVRRAKQAHKGSSKSFRLRTYYCTECNHYHVTNRDKEGRAKKSTKEFLDSNIKRGAEKAIMKSKKARKFYRNAEKETAEKLHVKNLKPSLEILEITKNINVITRALIEGYNPSRKIREELFAASNVIQELSQHISKNGDNWRNVDPLIIPIVNRKPDWSSVSCKLCQKINLLLKNGICDPCFVKETPFSERTKP